MMLTSTPLQPCFVYILFILTEKFQFVESISFYLFFFINPK